ncbi:hypothetical protein QA612_17075 [Evansella sp. AB-P1]|uniref:hypothetical protein n=1 Tax=Evansella sp. AB-P1 TaxID=3037653 RepID=UPI00241EE36A|nr:hypothetical protein [Evansella sp. AB-P1]MDG5789173.1 hypothetical protein [Evansella sp. AB-P1]
MQGIQQTLSANKADQFILPFSFIITSFFSLVIFSVSLIITPSAFLSTVVRQPDGLSLSHLFILGWATMLAMGAVYQLIAVVTQQSIYSLKLGFFHFGFYIIGVMGLFLSLKSFHVQGMAIFGTSTVIGVALFLFNVLSTIKQSKLKNPVITASTSALIYLGLTVFTGLVMVLNFQFSFLGSSHSSILIIHLWVGLVGWFLFLIVGYSFKMLPMFYLSHGHSEKWQKWILFTLHGAIIVSAIAALLERATLLFPLSLGLLSLSLVLFILQIKEIQSKKFKKNPGKGISFFVFLVYLFTFMTCSTFLASIFNTELIVNNTVIAPLLFFYIFGFVSISILAYLSKIIPFLWWTFRYGNQVGKTDTPSLSAMMNETIVLRKLILIFISLLIFICGLIINIPAISFLTSGLFAFSIVYYLGTLIKAFTI